jgi:hypothetical protein
MPLIVHVLRDPSASFARTLRNADLQFGLTKPHLKSGKGIMVATNEGDSFPKLLRRFADSTPDLLILDSQADVPDDPRVRNQVGKAELVCGQHPAFIPTSVSGEEREAAEMYLRFLVSRCATNVTQPAAAVSTRTVAETEEPDKDPHRPVCASARCRKIKQFLKDHYCGESPFGNGPDDGCEIRRPKKAASSINLIADFDCKWSDSHRTSKCQQHSQPSSAIREILFGEMRRLGLPTAAENKVYFTVWESPSSGWSVAEADYYHLAGLNLTRCRVIVVIDQSSRVRVLRKMPFHKTDSDTPEGTTWSLLGLADVDGDGHVDVILEEDSYEDHWLEVESVQGESAHTIFSGLGYYL